MHPKRRLAEEALNLYGHERGHLLLATIAIGPSLPASTRSTRMRAEHSTRVCVKAPVASNGTGAKTFGGESTTTKSRSLRKQREEARSSKNLIQDVLMLALRQSNLPCQESHPEQWPIHQTRTQSPAGQPRRGQTTGLGGARQEMLATHALLPTARWQRGLRWQILGTCEACYGLAAQEGAFGPGEGRPSFIHHQSALP